MTRIVCKIGFGRGAVNRFQREVNQLLEQGYVLEIWSVERFARFRVLCKALLKKAP